MRAYAILGALLLRVCHPLMHYKAAYAPSVVPKGFKVIGRFSKAGPVR